MCVDPSFITHVWSCSTSLSGARSQMAFSGSSTPSVIWLNARVFSYLGGYWPLALDVVCVCTFSGESRPLFLSSILSLDCIHLYPFPRSLICHMCENKKTTFNVSVIDIHLLIVWQSKQTMKVSPKQSPSVIFAWFLLSLFSSSSITILLKCTFIENLDPPSISSKTNHSFSPNDTYKCGTKHKNGTIDIK